MAGAVSRLSRWVLTAYEKPTFLTGFYASQGLRAAVAILREEWFLLVSLGTCLCFFLVGDAILAHLQEPVGLAVIFTWLFVTMLGSSLAAVRHADQLAVRLGEPYGTLLLTLSVTFIEVVSISAVMTHGENNPTLARDTLFAVVMIVLNGMVGLCLLMGGWRHCEQHYNLQGAKTYLSVIISLVVLSLVLPAFTQTTPTPTLSGAQQVFLVLVAVGLYVAFLAIQTGRHREYFVADDIEAAPAGLAEETRPFLREVILLLAYLGPVVFLAEQLAHPVDYLVETLEIPTAFGGVIMALLVATPEGIGALRAAMSNQLQRSVNIFLGSVLSTIGLTIPGIIVISQFTGRSLILGVQHADLVMQLLTLAVSMVTFSSERTNVIQGAVHLVFFGGRIQVW